MKSIIFINYFYRSFLHCDRDPPVQDSADRFQVFTVATQSNFLVYKMVKIKWPGMLNVRRKNG